MSSPIALQKKDALRSLLIRLHQKLSHSRRVEILAARIAEVIARNFNAPERILCLDVGCGGMELSSAIGRLDRRTVWECIDLYDLPDTLRESAFWSRYRKYDGRRIPFDDRSMDLVLLCDVLHHARDGAPMLLREACRVGLTVVVKDHFEYTLYSRSMLKAMDFIGNWGYGVALPKKYFTRDDFEGLCRSLHATVKEMETGIDLYSELPVIRRLLSPSWQFIAILESAAEGSR